MKNTILLISLMAVQLFLSPLMASSEDRSERRQSMRQLDREEARQDVRQNHRKESRVEQRQDYRKKAVMIQPLRPLPVRRYGTPYRGYGFYRHDDDAWKWLAFTAISLKILDNLNEQAQRQHEAAQIEAASAAVGKKVMWNDAQASGYVVTVKEYPSANGVCREFRQQVQIGNNIEQAYGTACLQPDGAWKIVS